VYRSDALHLLTPADVRRLRDDLGLTTVVDLRSGAELASDGRGPLAGEPITFHHVPLFDAEHMTPEARSLSLTLADRYALLAEFAAARIGRVLLALSEAGGPAVYHCAAGKDRTGVISAILLGVLDVPDEAIVADYVASRENLDAIIARLMETEGYQKMLAALPPETLHAEPATMEAFLARVRERHGSFRDYARTAGVDDPTVARLAADLTE
jgi:protein tyrosine/serine phosphatase